MKLKKQNIFGFSLIELSLLLIVFGALAVAALQNLSSGSANTSNKAIYKQMKVIKSAILAYQKTVGYYPCPANPFLDSSDENYAVGQRYTNGNCVYENTTEASATCNSATPGSGGSLNNVLCYKHYTVDRTNVSVNYSFPKADIIMGTVPCEDIGLNRDCMETPDGQKIAYATSTHLSRINPCTQYLANTGNSIIDGLHKFKIFKNYDKTISAINNYTASSGANRLISTDANQAEFVLTYFGSDNIGGWTKAGTRIIANSISSGGYENDNIYQQINHNLNTTDRQIDEYFIIPAKPLDNPDANLTTENIKIIFGDILVFGKATTADLPKKLCIDCSICGLSGGVKYGNEDTTPPASRTFSCTNNSAEIATAGCI